MATLVELDGIGPTIGRDVFLAPTREDPQRAADEYQHLRARYLAAASTTA